MANQDITNTDPGVLARLMTLGSARHRAWRPEELGAVYRHQMSSAVQFDLASLTEGVANQLTTLSSSEGLLIKSYFDLLQHPHPPVELLILTKRFAKANIGHPDSALPEEVAKVLYYVSIVVALIRCGQRITTLDDRLLRLGIAWAATQPWVDEPTKVLLSLGLDHLDTHAGQTA